MKKYSIWLLMVFGYANPLLSDLMKQYKSAESLYNAFQNNTVTPGYKFLKSAKGTEMSECEKCVEKLEKNGIEIIPYDSDLYPENLKSGTAPPCVLFAKGNVKLLKEKPITIGGARKVTDYTIAAEKEICSALCKNYTIVASLGEGCERIACETAIGCGTGCIEVMPCGFDAEYPKGSQKLRRQLLENGNCIISEFLPNEKPFKINFLRRARITGGISKAMLIFQAGLNSGSLNAAKYSPALFFLPPNNVFAPEYAGAVQAVRKGANLYYGEEDIEQAFSDSFTAQPVDIKPEKTEHKEKTVKAKSAEKEKAPSVNKFTEESFETPMHYSVFGIISKSENSITFDEIFNKTNADISVLNEILLDLEIEGVIKTLPGSRYSIN